MDKNYLMKIKNKFDFSNIKKYGKEFILMGFAIVLIGIGYMNYDKQEVAELASSEPYRNELELGDAKLVSSDAIVENDETSVVTNIEEDYFSKTKLERNAIYSETLETYQKIVDNVQITNEQKAIAIQEISKITEEKNAIQIAENLIKNKGFENVVILKNSDSVNVIIKAKKLEKEDIAKIQNIVIKELNVKIGDVSINCK